MNVSENRSWGVRKVLFWGFADMKKKQTGEMKRTLPELKIKKDPRLEKLSMVSDEVMAAALRKMMAGKRQQ